MQRPVHLALILCLALTAIGLGAARGTVVRAEQIVLCTGKGVVVVEQPGGPQEAHVCPDMALSLLVAMPDAPPDPVQRDKGAKLQEFLPVLPAKGRDLPRQAARGPPSSRISETKPV